MPSGVHVCGTMPACVWFVSCVWSFINILLRKGNIKPLNGEGKSNAMATMVLKQFKEHPVRTSVFLVIILTVLVFAWLLLFNFWKNSLDGCSAKMHSTWLQKVNPSGWGWCEVSVIPSFANIGCSGKANTALTGQAILADGATNEDRVFVAQPGGSLA